MNLSELFTSQTIAAYWSEAGSNRTPYLGEGLFPSKKKAGLDLSWIKGHKGLPISLAPSNFDAKASFRDRIGVSKIQTEMPFFREGMLISEKDRQEILRAKDSKDPYVESVLAVIFNDAGSLIEGANVAAERMRMQLLSSANGKPSISISANGVSYIYDYDPDNEYKSNNYMALSAKDKWSDSTNANPLEDLRKAQDNCEIYSGSKPVTAIMSKKTFNYLLASDKVKSAVLAQNATANVFLTESIIIKLVSELLSLNIIVYNKKFKDESGTEKQFFADDVVTLLPDGGVGSTWYGTTPEEADLLGSGKAAVSIVNTGIAVTTATRINPVNVETIVSQIVLPSFERMDECYTIKVV